MRFCGEIQYMSERGPVHSDVCHGCNPKSPDIPIDRDVREFFHKLLDEWFDKSNGTGFFWLGNVDEIADNFVDTE